MKKHITIQDIALQTGYSMQTVSRVLNGHADLHTESTNKKIKAAAAQMGYVQNIYAKAMKDSRTWSIGVIMDPFFGSFSKNIFMGAHDELFARGFCPILLLNNRRSDLELLETLATRRVEGVIILPNSDLAERQNIVETIRKHQLPLVSLDCPLTKTLSYDIVLTDDKHGGSIAANHLLKKGHRRIAGIFMNYQSLLRRKEGFEKTTLKQGAPAPMILTDDALIDTETSVAPIRDFLAREKPTAVFASTDHLLPAIYRAAQDLGLSIPNNLSVIGFGDLDITAHLNPPATTLHQDATVMGQQAARLLVERIESPHSDSPPVKLQFKSELIIRASVAAPDSGTASLKPKLQKPKSLLNKKIAKPIL